MARRKRLEDLISKNTITEEMKLINGSETDYVTPTGKIYKDYGNDMYYPKSTFPNNNNNYIYCGITYPEGQRQRRVHILVAEAYIDNPNNYPIVGHKDNNKQNNSVENLYWTDTSENTQKAYDDGLAKNDKDWNDNQSIPVCMFNMKKEFLNKYGSVRECYRQTGITPTAILNQCKHNVKTKPRCGYYFRYLSEYESNGFVL